MIRHRNGDADLRVLERRYQADSSDINVYIAILAARRRAGIPVNQGIPPADVEAYAMLIEAMIETAMTTRPRVVMAARLGHEAVRLAAPGWEAFGDVLFDDYRSRRLALGAIRIRRGVTQSVALHSKRELMSFACECAERVLPIFEREFTDNMLPRLAIESGKAWVKSPTNKTAKAAKAAAYNIYDVVPSYYIINSTHAALAAAYACDAFRHSEYTVRVVFAATEAVYANTGNDADYRSELIWQSRRLVQYLLGEVSISPVVS